LIATQEMSIIFAATPLSHCKIDHFFFCVSAATELMPRHATTMTALQRVIGQSGNLFCAVSSTIGASTSLACATQMVSSCRGDTPGD
jgi:hypothetical protein